MSITNKVDQFSTDVDIAHAIIQGDEQTVVMTDGGPVKSLAKVQKDLADTVTQISVGAANNATRAEAARDAAVVNANLYPDVVTGRAAVSDGEVFHVEGDGLDIAAYVYRRSSASSSTLLATYPSDAAVSRQALLGWLGA